MTHHQPVIKSRIRERLGEAEYQRSEQTGLKTP